MYTSLFVNFTVSEWLCPLSAKPYELSCYMYNTNANKELYKLFLFPEIIILYFRNVNTSSIVVCHITKLRILIEKHDWLGVRLTIVLEFYSSFRV